VLLAAAPLDVVPSLFIIVLPFAFPSTDDAPVNALRNKLSHSSLKLNCIIGNGDLIKTYYNTSNIHRAFVHLHSALRNVWELTDIRAYFSEDDTLGRSFSLFSSVSQGKCQDGILNEVTTTSFHIFSNSLFTVILSFDAI
jgi:hypothetical protein